MHTFFFLLGFQENDRGWEGGRLCLKYCSAWPLYPETSKIRSDSMGCCSRDSGISQWSGTYPPMGLCNLKTQKSKSYLKLAVPSERHGLKSSKGLCENITLTVSENSEGPDSRSNPSLPRRPSWFKGISNFLRIPNKEIKSR